MAEALREPEVGPAAGLDVGHAPAVAAHPHRALDPLELDPAARLRQRPPRQQVPEPRGRRGETAAPTAPARKPGLGGAPAARSSPQVFINWPAGQERGLRPRASRRCASITWRGRREQLRGDVVPDLGEEGVAGALAAIEGGEEAALAHLAVLDVLGEFGGGVGDPGPVAGADQLGSSAWTGAGTPCRRRASRRRAGRRSSPAPRTRSPLKQTPSPVSRQTWSAAWPGVARARRPACSSPPAGRIASTSSRSRPVGVIAVAVGEEDRADPAALLGRGADRVEVLGDIGARVDHRAGVGSVEVGVGPLPASSAPGSGRRSGRSPDARGPR